MRSTSYLRVYFWLSAPCQQTMMLLNWVIKIRSDAQNIHTHTFTIAIRYSKCETILTNHHGDSNFGSSSSLVEQTLPYPLYHLSFAQININFLSPFVRQVESIKKLPLNADTIAFSATERVDESVTVMEIS